MLHVFLKETPTISTRQKCKVMVWLVRDTGMVTQVSKGSVPVNAQQVGIFCLMKSSINY